MIVLRLRFIFVLAFVSLFVSVLSQESKIDSLKNIISELKDEAKVDALIKLLYVLPREDNDSLFKYANKALELSDHINYLKGKGQALYLLSWYYIFNSDKSAALEMIDSALVINLVHGDSLSISNSYRVYGYISVEISNYSDAIGYFKNSINYLHKDSLNRKHEILESIGISQYNLSNYNESLKTLIQVLKYNEKREDIESEAHLLSLISGIYIETGEKEQGIKNLRKALKLGYEIEDDYIIAESLLSIGDFYKEEKQLDSALFYLRMTAKYAEKTNHVLLVSDTYSALGESFVLLNNYDSAQIYFLKALRISEKSNDNWAIVYGNIGLAKVYKGKGNYGKSLFFLHKIKPKAEEIKSKAMLKDLYELFSEVYSESGKYKDAYSFQLLYKNISDSLHDEHMAKEIANMKVNFETEKKEQENEKLLAENKLNEQTIKEQKLVGIGIFVILLFAVISAFILFRAKQKVRRTNFLLKERNQEIQNQNEEITVQAEELSVAYSKQKELEEFRHGLINMIVHDLKNPLNIILNLSEHRLVMEAGNKMLNLVTNILDVSKFEEAKMVIQPEVFMLNRAIELAIEKTSFIAGISNIEIVNNTENTVNVNSDYDLIERVFINLFSNAIKFSPKKSKVYINAQFVQENKFVRISIKDVGSGIPKEFQEKIFEKFTQVTAINSDNIRSTGLGLTFCKLSIEAHGGKIEVESEIKKGSTFLFTLPKA